jgi:hypothetical protein
MHRELARCATFKEELSVINQIMDVQETHWLSSAVRRQAWCLRYQHQQRYGSSV